MKKFVLLFVLASCLVATSIQAQEAAPAIEVSGRDDLVKEKGRFKETWVRPDADFTRYSTLYLWVAELQFREVTARPADTAAGSTTRVSSL
jgi:hypothetical protein